MESMSEADNFNSYARRCGVVFAALACATLLMVGASAAHISSQGLKIGLVLTVAGFNAALVAGYLMHLVSERRTIYAVLAFTIVFFAGLMGLTLLAWHDVPAVMHP